MLQTGLPRYKGPSNFTKVGAYPPNTQKLVSAGQIHQTAQVPITVVFNWRAQPEEMTMR